jgi:hypothetical protein
LKISHPGKLREIKRALTQAVAVQALESERGQAVARDTTRGRRPGEKAAE